MQFTRKMLILPGPALLLFSKSTFNGDRILGRDGIGISAGGLER